MASCALSADNELLATSGEDGTVCLWHLPDGDARVALWRRASGQIQELPRRHGTGHGPAALAWSGDGRWLVSSAGGPAGGVQVWNAAAGQPAGPLLATENAQTAVATSPDGAWVAASGHR